MPSTPDLDSDAESDGDEASSTPESGSDSDSEGDWRSDSSRLSDTIPSLVQSAKNPDGLRYFQDWIQDLRPKFNQFYSSNDYINDHETLRVRAPGLSLVWGSAQSYSCRIPGSIRSNMKMTKEENRL